MGSKPNDFPSHPEHSMINHSVHHPITGGFAAPYSLLRRSEKGQVKRGMLNQ